MLTESVIDDLTVFIISDFTGKTAETVINSVAIQFEINKLNTKKFTNVSTIDTLTEIINIAKKEKNVILAYTLVLPELCDYLEHEAKKFNLPTMDILGPFINNFSKLLDKQPQLEVGLSYKVSQDIFNKINFIYFNIKCDDGKNLNKLKEADIVLIGVSRTSKTPLSRYLSYQNYKVASISLSPELEPPQELYELSVDKVIGLVIDPIVLQKIRKNRLELMDFSQEINYVKLDRIVEELDYAEKVINRLDCKAIDITYRSIEEIANEIVDKVN